MQDSYNKVFDDKERVMFIFAHPDDAEIYAGGTIARLVENGKKVFLVKMTTGNKGSRSDIISEKELGALREKEDSDALKALGLKSTDSTNLNLGDGEIENNLRTIGLLANEIRKFKPDLVVTHNPENKLIRDLDGYYYVNHRDHLNTALCAVDAVYPYSRDNLFFPEQLKDGAQGHTCTEFLFVDSWGHQDTVYIEITTQADRRTRAIASHVSQYPSDKAQDSTDYFAPIKDGKRFEQFRYVVAD